MTEHPRDPNRNDPNGVLPPVSGEAEYVSAVSEETLDRIASATVYDVDGHKVGSVGRVYLRDETGNPSWVTVKSGFFGLRESLVPMQGAHVVQDEIRVPYSKDRIKGAPHIDVDEHLSPAEEDELRRYYGVQGVPEGEARPGGAAATAPVTEVTPVTPVTDAGTDAAAADPGVVPVTPTQESPVREEPRGGEPADAGDLGVGGAGPDISEVDEDRREDRFEEMERRTDRLKDTTVEDALIAGSAGVAGAGVVPPADLPRDETLGDEPGEPGEGAPPRR